MSLNDGSIGYQFKSYFAIFLCFFLPIFCSACEYYTHIDTRNQKRTKPFVCFEYYRWLLFDIHYMQSLSSLSMVSHKMCICRPNRTHTPTDTQHFSPFRIHQFFFKLIALVFQNKTRFGNISWNKAIHTIDP